MRFFVFCTLASDNRYVNYERKGNDLPIADGVGVLIKGGAGVANDRLVTPRGVVTEVSAAQLEYLNHNQVFQLHQKNGFIKVEESARDTEAAASDMNAADPGRPLEEADFTDGDDNEPKPSTGGKKSKK